MFGLCDCNNFFVSCQRVFAPSLNDKPVAILSSNDGCIIARSNEAKALGLKMGQPIYQVKDIIEKNNVTIISSNLQLYGDMSHRVMMTLKEMVPALEIYSIDEAFLNLDGFPIDELQQRGRTMAKIINRNTGIPVSIGIAPTKTLAKIASKLCKSYPKLQGCCLMYRQKDIDKVLKTFPVEDVWGIGRRYAKMLQAAGINTAYQFTQCSPEWIRTKMSIVGLRTWRELRGESCIEFEHSVADKQTICVSRSFAKPLTTFEELHSSLSTFVSMASEKLRRQKSVASQMQVFILTNRHRPDLPQSYESRLVKFQTPTDSTLELVAIASQALKIIFNDGFGYKKAGVILSDITPKTAVQTVLFDPTDRTKHSSLMQTIDRLNATHGHGTITVAAQGFDPIQSNSNHLSPRYTTQWSEILKIKV